MVVNLKSLEPKFKEKGKGEYQHIKRRYGRFHRRFSLPDSADADKITASDKLGVLEISIAKREVAKPRLIAIKH